jgi:hypothetical protein
VQILREEGIASGSAAEPQLWGKCLRPLQRLDTWVSVIGLDSADRKAAALIPKLEEGGRDISRGPCEVVTSQHSRSRIGSAGCKFPFSRLTIYGQ